MCLLEARAVAQCGHLPSTPVVLSQVKQSEAKQGDHEVKSSSDTWDLSQIIKIKSTPLKIITCQYFCQKILIFKDNSSNNCMTE